MFVFTDASYSTGPKMSGCGVIIVDKNGDIYSFGNYTRECKNNNIAEVWAVHQASARLSIRAFDAAFASFCRQAH